MFESIKMKEFISDTGVKQKRIAERTGIPESVLSLILAGKRKCNVDEYVSLCFALNVPIGEFIHKQVS